MFPRRENEIDYLLEAVNSFFGASLGPGDLTGAFAGVRPLISTGDPKKSVRSRARPSCMRPRRA